MVAGGQHQSGNDGEDGGECNRTDKTHEDITADDLGQVNRRHIVAADNLQSSAW